MTFGPSFVNLWRQIYIMAETKKTTKKASSSIDKPAKKKVSSNPTKSRAGKTSSSAVKTTEKKASPKKIVKKDSSVFAIVETGGKQYQVSVGDLISTEIFKEEKKEGDKVVFESVLLVEDGKDTTIGTPYIKGAQVEGEVEETGKGKKVMVVRYNSKSRHLVHKGHRQPFLAIRITNIK